VAIHDGGVVIVDGGERVVVCYPTCAGKLL
jgi:hypothetical protein